MEGTLEKEHSASPAVPGNMSIDSVPKRAIQLAHQLIHRVFGIRVFRA
jgi:hypothetical protein